MTTLLQIPMESPLFDGAEAVSIYTCSQCEAEFEVLTAEVDGCWTLVGSDSCPECGHNGSTFDVEVDEAPDFWDLAEAA